VFLKFPSVKLAVTGIFIPVIFILFSSSSKYREKSYGTNIEYYREGSGIIIEGTYKNQSFEAAEIFYDLIIRKENSSGSSSITQSGSITIKPGSKAVLSRSKLDLSRDSVYMIHLIVKKGNSIISDEELKLKGPEILKD
jgi:hypothetical protein